ncbi:MAG: magnesium transporter [Blastocatellia bacterium]
MLRFLDRVNKRLNGSWQMNSLTFTMNPDDGGVLLRVIVICFFAGLLGWERETSGKAAGMRTHILVGVAAVLFTAVGEFMAVSFRQYGDHVRFDAAGLVGAIVSGISFLGAGMIFFKRNSGDVRGLTTAAGIVTTAAIGILVGLDRFFLAAGCTAIVFSVLRFVSILESRLFRRPSENSAPSDGNHSD